MLEAPRAGATHWTKSCITYAFNALMLVARRKAAERQADERILIVEAPAASGADPLPFASLESRAVTRAFRNSADVIAGPKATRSEVLAALGDTRSCIPLATETPIRINRSGVACSWPTGSQH